MHFVVPAGGIDEDRQQWINSHPKFLVDVKELSKIYRRIMLREIEKLWSNQKLKIPDSCDSTFEEFSEPLQRKAWNVYCEKPLKGPVQIINYLGKYVNRVAISNRRIEKDEAEQVTICYTNHRTGQINSRISIPADEFIQRFLKHIVPKGFYRIRYYGLYAQCATELRDLCCEYLHAKPFFPRYVGLPISEVVEMAISPDFRVCPNCKKGKLGVFAGTKTLMPQRE